MNIHNVIIDNASTFAYITTSNDCFRLRHVNALYVKIQNVVLILATNFKDNNAKCQIYVETKLTKKSCKSIHMEFEL